MFPFIARALSSLVSLSIILGQVLFNSKAIFFKLSSNEDFLTNKK